MYKPLTKVTSGLRQCAFGGTKNTTKERRKSPLPVCCASDQRQHSASVLQVSFTFMECACTLQYTVLSAVYFRAADSVYKEKLL